MSQFDLIEDYLTNRLDENARATFEMQMNADPELRAEVGLQKGIIEGVKSARAAELKAMLNNVPVGGATTALTGKIVIATISAGILGTLLYFGLRPAPTTGTQPGMEETVKEQPVAPVEEPKEEVAPITEPTREQKAPQKKKPGKDHPLATQQKTEKAAPPRVEVLDLTEGMDENQESISAPKVANTPSVSPSTVEVELDKTNKAYSFHYQFKDSKLVLYGPFDSSLYEIIELNGGVHSIFLYYDHSYYKLDEKEHNIAPLIMIRDKALLGKLEEYRNKD